jgi:uncharacterized protein (TIGR03118 family)
VTTGRAAANRRTPRRLGLVAITATAVVAGVAARPTLPARADEGAYKQSNLVSSVAGRAATTDADLLNPWGIVAGPTTPFWVADNNAGVSTLYRGNGSKVMLSNGSMTIPHVNVPAPGGRPGAPTGIVFAKGKGFTLHASGKSGDSFFIFSTEDGTIAAWSPAVDFASAVITVDKSNVPSPGSGAVYKGLALASRDGENFLYATNFRAGTVDVFDSSFTEEHLGKHAFKDSEIPNGYAPFGIAAVPQGLLVSYAQQNPDRHDDIAGPGHGFVDLYSPSGRLLHRLIERGKLNSPWGMVMAPSKGFGKFSGDLLVGNFGDGRINAYQSDGEFAGTLRDDDGRALANEGLWGLSFGNGGAAGPTTTLFFTAGINREADGLFGAIAAS